MPAYTELQVCSNYSFLRGASRIEELMLQAKALGYDALAITDRNSLAGIARAHARASEVGIRLVVGCRIDLTDGLPVLAYPTDRAGYARLCRLLTLGKSRGAKGTFDLSWADLAAAGEGLLLIMLPDEPDDSLEQELRRMRSEFPGRCHLALTLRRRPGDAVRLHGLAAMAQAARVSTVVVGDVLYHAPQRRILQDVITCIREGCTIDDAGYRRERFADRHLKAPEEMARLYEACPEAVARSGEIAARCTFSLAELSELLPVWWTRCLARGGDPLKLHRAEIADGRVASPRVVETLNVVEHVSARLIAGAVDFARCAFGFERGEEALHGGVVPDVARAAHATDNTIVGHQLLKLLAGVLAALVRMMQQRIWSAASPDRHHQRVRHQLRCHSGVHRPANHAA